MRIDTMLSGLEGAPDHAWDLQLLSEGRFTRGGRKPGELAVTAEAIVCCGRTDEELETARSAGRWLLAFYASTPANRLVLEVEGWADLQPELRALSKTGRWDEMPALIDDAVLTTIAAVGTANEVTADIAGRSVARPPDRRQGVPA
jgi:hypothetical protein